jgi:mannose-6-phosphate isomerase-like protein (cupin superfamily)
MTSMTSPADSFAATSWPLAPQPLDGRLIALHPGAHAQGLDFAERGRTDADWIIGIKAVSDGASVHANHWERHPRGEEVLALLDGRVSVILDGDAARPAGEGPGAAGQLLVVPRGTGHRLRVEQPGRLLFVTPSQGSEHRRVEAA